MFNRIVRFFVAAVFMAVSFCAFSKDFFVVALPVEGPWNYFQEDGEQLTGIDIDILRAISRESGYKFEFKPMSPSRAMAELKNDNIDAIAGVSSNFATVNGLLFTKPYMSDISQMVYQKPDAQKPVTKYKDLYTHVVGVIRTFSYFDELDDDPLITKEYSEDPEILFGKLNSGELDTVVASEWESAYYLTTHSLPLHTFVPASVNLTKHRYQTDRVIAFAKGFDRGVLKKIQRTIIVLSEDNIISTIVDSYWSKFMNSKPAAEGEGESDSAR